MANKIMKTLTMGENIYEIYDESARTDIATLQTETSQLQATKVDKPTDGNGAAGQVLVSNGDGTTSWGEGSGADNEILMLLLKKLGLTIEDLQQKIPTVKLVGDITGISADNYVNVTCNFEDSLNNVSFTDFAEIAWQGSSSIGFTKVISGVDVAKNYKIKLYSDEERTVKNKRTFKDWHATNNFHIKANYGDCTNFMNNMMMHFLTKSYQYLTPLPRTDARYTVDGFPVLLYINDVFAGIRFWNLKQDDKVYSLNEEIIDKTTGTVTQEADLCYQIGLNNGSSKGDNSGAFVYGNLNSGSNAGKNFADAHAEIDYYWEDRVWDKTSNHPDILYNTIQWVSEATDEEFKANLSQYFDVDYLIHYFVMMYTCGMGDSICKNFNMLYFPDKGIWYPTFWDMDFAFGTGWSLQTTSYNIDVLSSVYGASRLFVKLWNNFQDEIKEKYAELRKTILTVKNVSDSINEVWGIVTTEQIVENDTTKYSGTSYAGKFKQDGANYVEQWASDRLTYIDSILGADVKTESITLNMSSLTFNDSSSQTLIATVTPSNSAEGVVWSSSNQSVATVINGIVTPVSNGSCVITATSGDFSATCNVTVDADDFTTLYEQGYINDSGELVASTNNYVDVNYLEVTAEFNNVAVKTNCEVPVGSIRLNEYDSNKVFIKRQYVTYAPNNIVNAVDIFLLDEDTKYVRIGFMCSETEESIKTLFKSYTCEDANISYEQGYINDSGELVASTTDYLNNYYDSVESGSTINISFGGIGSISTANTVIRVVEYDANKQFVTRSYSSDVALSEGYQLTLNANTKYIRVGVKGSFDGTIATKMLYGRIIAKIS